MGQTARWFGEIDVAGNAPSNCRVAFVRDIGPAQRQPVRTPRCKGTTCLGGGRSDVAGDFGQPGASVVQLLVQSRGCREKALRIGMQGTLEQDARRRFLDLSPRVHDDDTVSPLAHQAEIMGDQQE